MANAKISALPAASTPLSGAELVPVVQSGVTEQVSVTNLTAGRTVSCSALGLGGTPNELAIFNSTSAASYLQITNTGTGTTSSDGLFLGSFNAGAELKNKENADLSFGTNNTTRMTISSAGFVGLGCTPGAIGGDLDIIANQNGVGIGYSTSVYRRITVVSSNSTSFISGSNTATLSAAGAWTNASDARLKKNITDIKYGLDTVMATQPRSYNRQDVNGDFIGFVAQELKTLVPEVVFGSDDEQYTVDYGSLVAIAFKAIQELKAEIEILKGGK